jgi:hypothetical protein
MDEYNLDVYGYANEQAYASQHRGAIHIRDDSQQHHSIPVSSMRGVPNLPTRVESPMTGLIQHHAQSEPLNGQNIS